MKNRAIYEAMIGRHEKKSHHMGLWILKGHLRANRKEGKCCLKTAETRYKHRMGIEPCSCRHALVVFNLKLASSFLIALLSFARCIAFAAFCLSAAV